MSEESIEKKLQKQREQMEKQKVVRVSDSSESKKTKKSSSSSSSSKSSKAKKILPVSKTEEENKIRKVFENFLDKDYSKFKDAYKLFKADGEHEDPKQEWEDADEATKRKYVIQALRNDTKGRWERKNFLEKFERLTKKLQNKFIRDYLKQQSNYTTYYELWKKTKVKGRKQEIESAYEKTDVPYESIDLKELVENDIIERTKAYAEDHGGYAEIEEVEETVLPSYSLRKIKTSNKEREYDTSEDSEQEISEQDENKPITQYEVVQRKDKIKKEFAKYIKQNKNKPSVYGILRTVKDENEESHPENDFRVLAKPYIKALKLFGIKAKDFTYAELVDKYVRKLSSIDPKYADELFKMDEENLKETYSDLANLSKPEIVATLVLGKKTETTSKSLEDLIKEASSLGIEIPEEPTKPMLISLIFMNKDNSRELAIPYIKALKLFRIKVEDLTYTEAVDKFRRKITTMDAKYADELLNMDENKLKEMYPDLSSLSKPEIIAILVMDKTTDTKSLEDLIKSAKKLGIEIPENPSRKILISLIHRHRYENKILPEDDTADKNILINKILGSNLKKNFKKSQRNYDYLYTLSLQELQDVVGKDTGEPELFDLGMQRCIDLYRKFSWVEDKVESVWVALTNSKFSEKYFYPKSIEVINMDKTEVFYAPKPEFFALMCGDTGKDQEGQVLHIANKRFIIGFVVVDKYKKYPELDREGNVVKEATHLRIASPGYKNRSFLIQNENVFQKEKEFFAKLKQQNVDRIGHILTSPVSDSSINFCAKQISKALLSIAPYIDEYNIELKTDSENNYIKDAIRSFVKQNTTNAELFNQVAKLLVILQLKIADDFRMKIKQFGFSYKTLLNREYFELDIDKDQLTPQSRLDWASFYENLVGAKIRELAEKYFFELDPTARMPTKNMFLSISKNEPGVDYDYQQCENAHEILTIPRENIIFFRDEVDGKVYGFDKNILSSRFNDGDFTNPYTKRKFPKSFVYKYTVTYYDMKSGETFVLPFSKVYRDFVNQKFTLPNGNEFDDEFIKVVLSKPTEKASLGDRGRRFERIESALVKCKNYSDAISESVENLVMYEESNGDRYCFPKRMLKNMIETDSFVNPYNQKKLSKEFIKRISKFNLETISLPKKQDAEQDKKEKEEKEKKEKDEKLVEEYWKKRKEQEDADVWEKDQDVKDALREAQGKKPKTRTEDDKSLSLYRIILNTVKNLEKASKFGFSSSSSSDRSEGGEGGSDATSESSTESSSSEDEESSSEGSEESDSESSSSEDEESDSDSEEEDEENVSVESKDESKDGKNANGQKCYKCDKPTSDQFKTIIEEGGEYKTIYFCCLKCFEDYKFRKPRKNKK